MAARQIELFYLGADPVPAGALVTSREENYYRCRISFSTPDGTTIDNDAVIAARRSMRDWTAFSFSDGGQVIHGARDDTGVSVAGKQLRDEAAVPSYGVSFLVLELVEGSGGDIEFGWLEEARGSVGEANSPDDADSPDDIVRPARLEQCGPEDVTSPVAGFIPGCRRIELTVAGTRTNTYWVADGRVVATDWGGAMSFALPSAATEHLERAAGMPR